MTQSETAIEICQLEKRFDTHCAVNQLSLTVKKGEILALLGPNGAGKTTTINCILGFLTPDSGQVRILGKDPVTDLQAVRQHLAYIPEQVALYPTLSGLENLLYMTQVANIKLTQSEAYQLLEEVGLPQSASNKLLESYSKGMRQKIGIAIALAKKAEVLILDEPTSGLDPTASHEFSQLIQKLAKQGVAILMATHDLYRAQDDADTIAILNQGKLVHYMAHNEDASLEALYLEHVKASSC